MREVGNWKLVVGGWRWEIALRLAPHSGRQDDGSSFPTV